ncbi:hypothetical protein TNCV_3149321 [Trichonephila clavipes]|nr:hypothetical protein TNCV_3149321 [Trichonephila clavipes]
MFVNRSPTVPNFSELLITNRTLVNTLTRLRTCPLRGMKIHRDGTRTYLQCRNYPDTELTSDYLFFCPAILAILQRISDCPQDDLYSDNCLDVTDVFGLAIHQNDHQARRRFVEWAQNEIAVVPDFHKRILFRDEAHFWLNGYVNKQNCRIWSEANPQVYVETPLHPEKLIVWCALWAGGILLQKR